MRDLYIENDWTTRFTDIFDENFKFSGGEKILYVNAGTGNHALVLREKFDDDLQFNAFGEDEESNVIAQAKSDAVKADVFFSSVIPDKIFDAVVADASFVEPKNLPSFLAKLNDLSSKQVAFFLPTARSFGEIFSFLWETLFDLNLLEKGTEVERLIKELPTVWQLEEMAEGLNLKNLQTVTKDEYFEFENGAEFVNSTLVADFLLPVWLDFLDAEEKELVRKRLAQIIDDADGSLTFRFSIKATLVTGEKVQSEK